MEAQPSHNIPGVRPSPNTPSDVSCSSGPCSVVSTRETSPASSTHYPLEPMSAARDLFISCPDAASAIPSPVPDLSRPRRDLCRPRPGLDAEILTPLEMNPNPFQAAIGRRSKLAAEDPRPSHTFPGATTDGSNLGHRLSNTPFRQSIAPVPSYPHSSIPSPSSAIPLGLRGPHWRQSTVSLETLTSPSPCALADHSFPSHDSQVRDFRGSSYHLPPFEAQNHDSLLGPYPSITGFSYSKPSSAFQPDDNHLFERPNPSPIATIMHPPTGTIIGDGEIDQAVAYCYARGDGQYTRLVPVDMLPMELDNIPRRVNSDAGMIVLPEPRQSGADGQPANCQLDQQRVATPPSSPNDNRSGNAVATTDSIQSRIDSIVSATPASGSGALVLSTRGYDAATPNRSITVHHHHHSAGSTGAGKKEKVFCDKWIHEGTCAFTQQGCKYKHEMPHDRATQESLGLFHGYPNWWKKLAAEQQRPLSMDDRPIHLSSHRPALPGIGLTASTSLGSGISNASLSMNWRSGPGPVGAGSGIQRSPSSPTPTAGSNSSVSARGGSIGFGSGGRGGARQPRTFASFTPQPTFGPIGPPSSAASGSASASGSVATTTPAAATTSSGHNRNARSLTTSSTVTSSGDQSGGGAPYNGHQRSAYSSGNPYAALSDLAQSTGSGGKDTASPRREESSSSGDNTAADGEQRGAPL